LAIDNRAINAASHATHAGTVSEMFRKAAEAWLIQASIAVTGFVDLPIAVIIKAIAVIAGGSVTPFLRLWPAFTAAVLETFIVVSVTVIIDAIADFRTG